MSVWGRRVGWLRVGGRNVIIASSHLLTQPGRVCRSASRALAEDLSLARRPRPGSSPQLLVPLLRPWPPFGNSVAGVGAYMGA